MVTYRTGPTQKKCWRDSFVSCHTLSLLSPWQTFSSPLSSPVDFFLALAFFGAIESPILHPALSASKVHKSMRDGARQRESEGVRGKKITHQSGGCAAFGTSSNKTKQNLMVSFKISSRRETLTMLNLGLNCPLLWCAALFRNGNRGG